EARYLALAERDAEVLGDLFGQGAVRVPGEELQLVRHGRLTHDVVGAGGFEPPNTGSKVPRLAAWPRPIKLVSRRPLAVSPGSLPHAASVPPSTPTTPV